MTRAELEDALEGRDEALEEARAIIDRALGYGEGEASDESDDEDDEDDEVDE